jgi:hypothetical protein
MFRSVSHGVETMVHIVIDKLPVLLTGGLGA